MVAATGRMTPPIGYPGGMAMHHHITLPAMDAATLRRLVEILAPFSAEPLSRSAISMAYRLAMEGKA